MKISREFPYEDLKGISLRKSQGNFLRKNIREFTYEDLKGISLRKSQGNFLTKISRDFP